MYTYRIPSVVKAAYPSVTWSKRKQKDCVYFTFDDGPHPDTTPQILELLRSHNAKATFFCVGENVKRYPELFNQILEEGHTVGNHTYNHLNGLKTSKRSYIQNIEKARAYINSRLFRPPYGKMKMSQLSHVKKEFEVVLWSLLIGDFDPAMTKEQCYFVLKNKLKGGDIVVMHDNVKSFGKMIFTLEKGLDLAKEKNLKVEPL